MVELGELGAEHRELAAEVVEGLTDVVRRAPAPGLEELAGNASRARASQKPEPPDDNFKVV